MVQITVAMMVHATIIEATHTATTNTVVLMVVLVTTAVLALADRVKILVKVAKKPASPAGFFVPAL